MPAVVESLTYGEAGAVDRPTGGVAGDIYVIHCVNLSGSGAPTWDFEDDGFTTIMQGGFTLSWFGWFFKVRDGTEPSTWTPTGDVGGIRWTSFIVRGANVGQIPLEGTPAVDTAEPTSLAVGGVTVAVADTLCLVGFHVSDAVGSPSTPPSISGWTEESLGGGDRILVSSKTFGVGATGSASVTWSPGIDAAGGMIGFAPTVDPTGAIDGCKLWLDFDDVASLTIVSDEITGAVDKSGSGFNQTVLGGGAGPDYAPATLNGRGVAIWPGPGLGLRSLTFAISQPYTLFMIIYFASMSAGVEDIMRGANDRGIVYHPVNGGSIFVLGTASPPFPGAAYEVDADIPYYTTVVFDGASSHTRLNGAAAFTGVDVGSEGMTAPTNLGRRAGSENGLGNMPGSYVGEVIIYDTALDSDDIDLVESYLLDKWFGGDTRTRTFTGGDSDRLDGATVTAINSGGFSMGCWIKTTGDTSAFQGIIEIADGTNSIQMLGTRGGTNGIYFGQGYTGGGHCGTISDQFAFSNSTWTFVCGVGDGGTVEANYKIWIGTVGSAVVEQTHNALGTGGGSRMTGGTAVCVGNHNEADPGPFTEWTGNTTGSFPGSIFAPFVVPWQLTEAEMNELRTGDLCPLTDGGTPTFFFGLEGADLDSYPDVGPSLTLTNTGTTLTGTAPVTLTPCSPPAEGQTISVLSRNLDGVVQALIRRGGL